MAANRIQYTVTVAIPFYRASVDHPNDQNGLWLIGELQSLLAGFQHSVPAGHQIFFEAVLAPLWILVVVIAGSLRCKSKKGVISE